MWILIVPILLPFLMIVGIVCLVMGKWIIGTFFILIAFFLNEWSQTFAYKGLFRSNHELVGNRSIKVLNYNVNNLHYFEDKNDKAILDFIDFMKHEDAEIVCFEEHTFIENYNIEGRIKEIYPYTSGKHDVYSKYPIHNHHQICLNDDDPRVKAIPGFLRLVGPYWREMPIWAMDISVDGSIVHLIDCYMMTNNFNRVKYDLIGLPRWKRLLLAPIRVFMYLRCGYQARALGAEVVRKEIDEIHGPLIVLGDFNDLSGSNTLRTVLGESLRNAWWEGGIGYGFTFCAQKMMLRLDHILFSPHFELFEIHIPHHPFSDHYPIVAELNF